MNKIVFKKLLERDGGCVHCGSTGDDLIPHHRRNRGMGGSRSLDNASNLVVMCSSFNSLMESDDRALRLAYQYGWKLELGVDPLWSPVYVDGQWWSLDDKYDRVRWLGFEPEYV